MILYLPPPAARRAGCAPGGDRARHLEGGDAARISQSIHNEHAVETRNALLLL